MSSEVVPVDRAVDDLAGLDPAGLDDHGLVEALADLRRVRARLEAVEARLGRRVELLSARCRLWTPAGRGRVAVIAAPPPGWRPVTTRPWATPTAVAYRDGEPVLVGRARTMRWADFARACAYWQRQARDHGPDPDKADRDHRHVSVHHGLRGTGLLTPL